MKDYPDEFYEYVQTGEISTSFIKMIEEHGQIFEEALKLRDEIRLMEKLPKSSMFEETVINQNITIVKEKSGFSLLNMRGFSLLEVAGARGKQAKTLLGKTFSLNIAGSKIYIRVFRVQKNCVLLLKNKEVFRFSGSENNLKIEIEDVGKYKLSVDGCDADIIIKKTEDEV